MSKLVVNVHIKNAKIARRVRNGRVDNFVGLIFSSKIFDNCSSRFRKKTIDKTGGGNVSDNQIDNPSTVPTRKIVGEIKPN